MAAPVVPDFTDEMRAEFLRKSVRVVFDKDKFEFSEISGYSMVRPAGPRDGFRSWMLFSPIDSQEHLSQFLDAIVDDHGNDAELGWDDINDRFRSEICANASDDANPDQFLTLDALRVTRLEICYALHKILFTCDHAWQIRNDTGERYCPLCNTREVI